MPTDDPNARAPAPLGEAHTQPEPRADPSGGAHPADHGTLGQSPSQVEHAAGLSREVPPDELPRIPGYEIECEVARGGMGVVYKALNVRLGRRAAVKMLLGGQYADPMARVRFLVEAEAVAQLSHPHIVGVHEFGQHDGQPFFALEFVDGGTLASLLARSGALPPRDAAAVVAKLADAMTLAHSKGIVHRDLKPANVLLTAAGEPKIADFGLAKVGSSDLTATGAVIGTPSYMSPEQAAGKTRDIGTATDVYALGAILYELLTGRPSFRGDSAMDTIRHVLTREPVALRAVNPRTPRDLETICLKCLEKKPERRYPTAAALHDDLRAFLGGRPITARPVGTIERVAKWGRRHPGRAVAAAAVGVLLVTAGALAVRFEQRLVEQRVAAERGFAEATRQKARETRADALVDALALADTAVVPRLVDDLRDLRDLAAGRLRDLAARPIDTKPGLHARLALLADEPGRAAELGDHLTRCRPEELLPVRDLLRPHAAVVAPPLWAALADAAAPARVRVRAAAALAGLAPGDPRWARVAPPLVEELTRENPLRAVAWAAALDPVRLHLLAPLLKRYPEARHRIASGRLDHQDLVAEASAFDLTADLLATYADGRPVELAELAVTVDPRHHRLFDAEVFAHRAAIAPILRAELDRPWLPHPAARGAPDVPFDPPVAAAAGAAGERAGAVSSDAADAAARRQANAAAALLKLGEPDAAWRGLRFPAGGDPSARGYLVRRLAAIGADPVLLARRFGDESDASARRALLLALGDYPPDDVPAADREPLVATLLRLYRTDPDPGTHSAIDWLLRRQWGRAADLARADAEQAAGGRAGAGWFVNREGQTYAVVRGPVEFAAGSPAAEPARVAVREPAHLKRIGRSFAVATREVTVTEFLRFRPDHAWVERYRLDPESPAVGVSFYAAAAYCNWLSRRDGLPEDQWCYRPNASGEYAEGMSMKPGHLALTGYRLPTEAEWEYAARAGSAVARHFGRSSELLPRYAWYARNSDDRAWPVGSRRPNDLGLFDTLGNALEWVEDPALLAPGARVDDLEHGAHLEVNDRVGRLLRGGSFDVAAPLQRTAERTDTVRPSNQNRANGFRPARTVP
ncbi:bifunctional serine/threonine-protein kinase/formylglycine-generating enzyme family protein [Gemmata sp.]|uniref:bifunctional serine/threonine-protein kinase/formylglycine-generating enzyme family protein n=1 Tax=Gemmata sp. TaxID=1914242 RepID=UPI003F7139AB